jgi:hypothetical protein
MSLLVVSGTPDLEIHTGGVPYALDKGFSTGAKSYRRQIVESPFVHGRSLVGAVMDVQNLTVPVFVRGTSPADLRDKLVDLVEYFSQFSYTVTYYDGSSTDASYSWQAEIADYSIGNNGEQDDKLILMYAQTITFSVPCSPVAVGPL